MIFVAPLLLSEAVEDIGFEPGDAQRKPKSRAEQIAKMADFIKHIQSYIASGQDDKEYEGEVLDEHLYGLMMSTSFDDIAERAVTALTKISPHWGKRAEMVKKSRDQKIQTIQANIKKYGKKK